MKKSILFCLLLCICLFVGCETEDAGKASGDTYYLENPLDPTQYSIFMNEKINASIGSIQTAIISIKYVVDGTSSIENTRNEVERAQTVLIDCEKRMREMIPNEEYRDAREFALQEMQLTIDTLTKCIDELQKNQPNSGILSSYREELLVRYNGLTGAVIQVTK